MEIELVNSVKLCVSTGLPTTGVSVEISTVGKPCTCNKLKLGTTGFCVVTPVAVRECT